MAEGNEIEREARPPAAAPDAARERPPRRRPRPPPARREARAGQDPEDEAPAPVVERVEISRNQFLSAETLLFYISTKAGERYDQLRLREDFRRLWDTGFVDDLSIDVRDAPRRQGRHLRGQRAQAHPDRRLPRQQGPHHDRHRGRAQEEGRRAQASTPSTTSARRGGWRRILKEMLGREGPALRDRAARRQARSGGAGLQVSFVIDDGPEGAGQAGGLRGQRGLLRRRRCAARMKNIKPRAASGASRWLLGQDDLHAREVVGAEKATRSGSRTSTSTTATSPRPSASPRSRTSTAGPGSSEEAREVASARDPGQRGRAVPDRRGEVRGHDRLQAGAGPPALQARDGRRLPGIAASRRPSTSCATPTAPRATSSGRGGTERKPDPSARSWTSP